MRISFVLDAKKYIIHGLNILDGHANIEFHSFFDKSSIHTFCEQSYTA